MTILIDNTHLTRVGGLHSKAEATHRGMAYFAGTGPHDKTCRECQSFEFKGFYVVNGVNMGRLKPGHCYKRTELMRGQIGEVVPSNAKSCRYFDENPKAPPAKTLGSL